MQLEDYFDFLGPTDIRIKGHRVGIENILYEYLYREQTPDDIAKRFPTLSLEQIYATILYYLHYREEVSAYMLRWIEYGRRAREEQERNPPPWLLRLRAAKAELEQEAAKAELEQVAPSR